MNNPIMYVDPSGHLPWLILICLSISTLLSIGSEAYEEYKGEEKEFRDYAGAAVGGVISGLGSGFISSVCMGVIGDIADGLISGEISSYEEVSSYVKTSVITNIVGYGIGQAVGAFAKGIGSFLKADDFIKLKNNNMNHNIINKELRTITNNLNIGSNIATRKNIAIEIFKTNKWKPGKYIKDIVSSFF